jgi:hypothetical protein
MICVDGSALIRFYNQKLIRRRFAAHFLYRGIEGEISHSNFLLKCNTRLWLGILRSLAIRLDEAGLEQRHVDS